MSGQVVIVGAGHAGVQVAATLRSKGYVGTVTLVDDENRLPYQRPQLSKGFLDPAKPSPLALRPESFFLENSIDLLRGDPAVLVDRSARKVVLRSGCHLPYSHLVLATGAQLRRLTLPGAELANVLYLKTLSDAERIRKALEGARHVVIIGGGFVGLECAAAALSRNLTVTIVEAAERLMARAVTPSVSDFFASQYKLEGAKLLLGTQIVSLVGSGGRLTHVELNSGEVIPADIALVGIGVLANTQLARASGLAVTGGIVVDDRLLTSDPAISAIGDCAAFPSPHSGEGLLSLESIQNAIDQGSFVAERICGKDGGFHALPWFWSEQGRNKLQIAGLSNGRDHSVLRSDRSSQGFSVFSYRAGSLVCVESINRPLDHIMARRLLAKGQNIDPDRAADPSFDLRSQLTQTAD